MTRSITIVATLALLSVGNAFAQNRSGVGSSNSHGTASGMHGQRGPNDITNVQSPDLDDITNIEMPDMSLNGTPSEGIPFTGDINETIIQGQIHDAPSGSSDLRPATTLRPSAPADSTFWATQKMGSNGSTIIEMQKATGMTRPNAPIDPASLPMIFDDNQRKGDLSLTTQSGIETVGEAAQGATVLDPRLRLAAAGSLPAEPARRLAIERDPAAIEVDNVPRKMNLLSDDSIDDPAFKAEIAKRGIQPGAAFLIQGGYKREDVKPELLFLFPNETPQGLQGMARTFYSPQDSEQIGPLLIVSAPEDVFKLSQDEKHKAFALAIRQAEMALKKPQVDPKYLGVGLEGAFVPQALPPTGLQHFVPSTTKQVSPVEQLRLWVAHAASSFMHRLADMWSPSHPRLEGAPA